MSMIPPLATKVPPKDERDPPIHSSTRTVEVIPPAVVTIDADCQPPLLSDEDPCPWIIMFLFHRLTGTCLL